MTHRELITALLSECDVTWGLTRDQLKEAVPYASSAFSRALEHLLADGVVVKRKTPDGRNIYRLADRPTPQGGKHD